MSAVSDVRGGFSGVQRVYAYTISWDEDSVLTLGEIQTSSDAEGIINAPIQEPNTQRGPSGQVWTTSQLARRPAPAAAATVSIPTASLISSTQTLSPINSGDNTVLPDLSAATFKTNTSALTKADSGDGLLGHRVPRLDAHPGARVARTA